MFFSSSVDDNVSAVLEISSSTNDVSFAVFSSSFCGRISVACNSTAYEDLWPQSASFAHL